MASTTPQLTGGCQCGAVRFTLTSAPTRVSICHCRMCQKATGAPFASLADVPTQNVKWTRGAPTLFRSSSIAERGFCAACGTPLTYVAGGVDKIEIATGTFDRPDLVVPVKQFGTESVLPWVHAIADLPGITTDDNFGPEKLRTVISHQHPDHD